VEESAWPGVDKAMPRTQTHTPPRSRRRTSLLLAIAALLLLTVGATAAAASSTIEGVWSFNGGEIAIQPEGNGKFEGVVVQPTTFETCVHPDGQKIWKEMTLQTDGSYWGFHQWYKNTPGACVENPTLGPTAWRVFEEANGSRYLRVCLSTPGTAQPTIPPGSSGVGATYGCTSSEFTAAVPVVTGSAGSGSSGSGSTSGSGTTTTGSSGTSAFKESLALPGAKKCYSARLFKIHIQEPTYDPFAKVVVTLRGHKIATTKQGKFVVATVKLKGLPSGKFTVKITATTVLGHHLSASRTYHTCAKKPKRAKVKKLLPG
jgi:hypothetical protein